MVDNGHPPSLGDNGCLPFNLNEITPYIKEYAAKYLNETDAVKQKALSEFRQRMRSEEDIVFTDTDMFLLLFLRSRKFDVKRAFDLYWTGINHMMHYKHLVVRSDPRILRNVTAGNFIGFLPHRDPIGRAIIYCRAEAWNWKTITADDAIYGGVLAIQSAGHNEVNQIMGFMVVLDLQNLKMQQVVSMSRWIIFGTITLQRACPCFLKAFHIINIPPIFKFAWNIVKPLLSEKIRKRFVFHKTSDLTSLYEHIPKESLPQELGGPLPFTNDHWAWDLDNIEKEYYEYLNSNYRKSKQK